MLVMCVCDVVCLCCSVVCCCVIMWLVVDVLVRLCGSVVVSLKNVFVL